MGKITGNSEHPGAAPAVLANGVGDGATPDLAARHGPARHAASPICANGVQSAPRPADAARRLITAANTLLALAAELEGLPRHPRAAASGLSTEHPSLIEDDARWLHTARRAYRHRRTRTAIFGDESLFGEPAWDLLLDLFIAAKERKRVPVTSACIGSAVPTTTALRWLAVLEERGLVLREADPSDARRIFVRLSADAYARMVGYFVRTAMNDAEDTFESTRARSRSRTDANLMEVRP